MSPRLITRADDAGSFRSANQAILDSCTQGICRNVSLMAPCPEIAHAAELLAGRDEICFGLHATITCEWQQPRWGPCADPAQVPDLLADDGGLVHNPLTIHERGCPVEQILTELAAQLARLRELGFAVAYLDTHMPWDWMHPPGAEDQRIGRELERWAHAQGLRYWQQWGDMIGHLPKPDADHADPIEGHRAALSAFAAEAGDAIALDVQHPCYDDDEMSAVRDRQGGGGHGAKRDLQRRQFMDPATVAAVTTSGITLTRYDELPTA